MPLTSACVYLGPALHGESLDPRLAGELGAGSRRIAGDPEARPGRSCRLAKVTHSCPGASAVKNPRTVWETQVQPLGCADPRERGMATHSCLRAWRIPATGEPAGLQTAGSQRVRHMSTHTRTHTHTRSPNWMVGKLSLNAPVVFLKSIQVIHHSSVCSPVGLAV